MNKNSYIRAQAKCSRVGEKQAQTQLPKKQMQLKSPTQDSQNSKYNLKIIAFTCSQDNQQQFQQFQQIYKKSTNLKQFKHRKTHFNLNLRYSNYSFAGF